MNLLRVEEKRYNARFAKLFITFWQQVNYFNKTGAQILDAVYHMGLDARKPVFGGLQTTQVQTTLRGCVV